MEVTTWPKPSGNSCHEIRWQRECAGRNASKRRASLEKVDAQVDPKSVSGKTDTAVGTEQIRTQSLRRGTGGSMYTRKARATREAPRCGRGRPNGRR